MNNLKSKITWKNKMDKLLFVFASLYLMTTIAWLWKQNQQSKILQNATQNRENQTTVYKLDNNNQSLKNEQINTSEPDNDQLDISKSLTLTPSIPLPVVEEISNTALVKVTSLPSNNLEQNILPPPLPPPPSPNIQQNPQPISVPSLPTKTISSPTRLTKVPTINTLNATPVDEVAINNNLPSPSSSAISTNIGNIDYKYSLIGIVQLPDNKSFALFKINDLTERVPVGTEIGTSGWVLMAINGKQAIVSRQNKSINIRVGEKF